MIHPDTRLQFINKDIGLGVFATSSIPEGTITYVEDELEWVFPPDEFVRLEPDIRQKVSTYSYRDEQGNRIVSWDHAKYVNHSCDCNTISTGYRFEIAIKNIKEGEQITDEYALFNLEQEMVCRCGTERCRGVVCPQDFNRYYEQWDSEIKRSLVRLPQVEQPLLSLLDRETQELLCRFYDDPLQYRSVSRLQFQATKD